MQQHLYKDSIDVGGYFFANREKQFHDSQRNIHRLIAKTLILVKKAKKRNIISERFARNPAFLTRPQTFMLHKNLRHISSSEIIRKP